MDYPLHISWSVGHITYVAVCLGETNYPPTQSSQPSSLSSVIAWLFAHDLDWYRTPFNFVKIKAREMRALYMYIYITTRANLKAQIHCTYRLCTRKPEHLKKIRLLLLVTGSNHHRFYRDLDAEGTQSLFFFFDGPRWVNRHVAQGANRRGNIHV